MLKREKIDRDLIRRLAPNWMTVEFSESEHGMRVILSAPLGNSSISVDVGLYDSGDGDLQASVIWPSLGSVPPCMTHRFSEVLATAARIADVMQYMANREEAQ